MISGKRKLRSSIPWFDNFAGVGGFPTIRRQIHAKLVLSRFSMVQPPPPKVPGASRCKSFTVEGPGSTSPCSYWEEVLPPRRKSGRPLSVSPPGTYRIVSRRSLSVDVTHRRNAGSIFRQAIPAHAGQNHFVRAATVTISVSWRISRFHRRSARLTTLAPLLPVVIFCRYLAQRVRAARFSLS